jgi:uncharacterized Zn finger protein (UPF0148 family)
MTRSAGQTYADNCPVCGGELTHREGCAVCTVCGWTRC